MVTPHYIYLNMKEKLLSALIISPKKKLIEKKEMYLEYSYSVQLPLVVGVLLILSECTAVVTQLKGGHFNT